jgi:hypothetical protein
MVRRKTRASKSALNKTTEYYPTEEKNDLPEVSPEIKKMFEQELEEELENVELPTSDEIEKEIEDDGILPPDDEEYHPPVSDYPDKFPKDMPEVKKKQVITKDDLKNLSKSGLRYYQRTGRLPKQ